MAAVIDAECAFGLTGGRREVTGLRLPMMNQLDHADRLRKLNHTEVEKLYINVFMQLSYFLCSF